MYDGGKYLNEFVKRH